MIALPSCIYLLVSDAAFASTNMVTNGCETPQDDSDQSSSDMVSTMLQRSMWRPKWAWDVRWRHQHQSSIQLRFPSRYFYFSILPCFYDKPGFKFWIFRIYHRNINLRYKKTKSYFRRGIYCRVLAVIVSYLANSYYPRWVWYDMSDILWLRRFCDRDSWKMFGSSL